MRTSHSAILYYDFILTFRLEVEQFWGHRLSWASGLFFLNRYSSILFNIPLLYEYLGGPSESVYLIISHMCPY